MHPRLFLVLIRTFRAVEVAVGGDGQWQTAWGSRAGSRDCKKHQPEPGKKPLQVDTTEPGSQRDHGCPKFLEIPHQLTRSTDYLYTHAASCEGGSRQTVTASSPTVTSVPDSHRLTCTHRFRDTPELTYHWESTCTPISASLGQPDARRNLAHLFPGHLPPRDRHVL